MDPLDLLTGSFRAESYSRDSPKTLDQVEQEEKREDNSSSSSEDEPEQDLDFPTTQVLAHEPAADEDMKETGERNLPTSPVVFRSPVKAKPHSSPAKARASPAKVRSSPAKKMRSPAKARSPAKPRSSPVKVSDPHVAPSPIVERLAEKEQVDHDTPEEFRAKGAAGKFTKLFPAVARLVEDGGWQIAQGHNTLFCSMPGVQFFSFKPNVNVFDSRIKACWKFIQIAGEKKDDTEDKELWDLLWPVVEKEFGWFTMNCGPEMWFVKPNTKFENFRPNETIFQTKKRAVLKCLAVEVGDIELGDSAEGHQVIAFEPRVKQPTPASAPKKVKTSLFKTPSPAVKSIKRATPASSSSAKVITLAKRVSPGSATNSVKRKLSSSSSKLASKSSASKKVKGGKTSAKKSTKKKKTSAASDVNKADEFSFIAPEFRCSFGIVYSKLQDEGWYHKNGLFEYDYFSPTYTETTKEIDVNYFQSQASLESFLKVSGHWTRIEDELRQEHDQVVEEERAKALERHHQRLEQQAARKRNLALNGAPSLSQTLAPKPKKSSKKKAPKKTSSTPPPAQSLYQAEVEAAKAAEAEEALSSLPKMNFGTVFQKLKERGWFCRPGRFEYDYFKPSANPKTAVSGEDRFESVAALEIYLKTTGMWEAIAEELTHDELSESPERPVKRSKLESPPPASAQSPKRAVNGSVQKEDVKSITNDIWANSHEFDFDE